MDSCVTNSFSEIAYISKETKSDYYESEEVKKLLIDLMKKNP